MQYNDPFDNNDDKLHFEPGRQIETCMNLHIMNMTVFALD